MFGAMQMKRNLESISVLCFALTFATSLVIWGQDAGKLWTAKYYAFLLTSTIGILLYFLSTFLSEQDEKEKNTTIHIAVIFYSGYFLLALLTTVLSGKDIFMNRPLVVLFVLALTTYSVGMLTKDKRNVTILIIAYQLITIIQSTLALLQLLKLIDNLFPQFSFGGAFGNPNILATYLTGGVVLSIGYLLLVKDKTTMRKWVSWIAFLTGASIVVLAGSRAAWIGLLVSMLIITSIKFNLYHRFWRNQSLIKRLVMALIFTAISVAAGYTLYQLKPASANGRLFIWQRTLEGIADKPLTGSGYGSFFSAYNNYQAAYFSQNADRVDEIFLADVIRSAYNAFLHIGLETGLIGLSLFLIFLFFVLRPLFQPDALSPDYIMVASALLGLLFISLFTFTIYTSSTYYVFIILIAICIGQSPESLVKIPKRKWGKAMLTISLMIALGTTIVTQYNTFVSQKKFTDLQRINPHQFPERVFRGFRKLESTMSNDLRFLNHVGQFYMGYKKYEDVVRLMNQGQPYFSDPALSIMLADAHYRLNQFDQAEQYYLKAMHIRPVLFRPRRRLVMLYKKNNRKEEMCQLIDNTLDMDVKVPSPMVFQILQELTALQKTCE